MAEGACNFCGNADHECECADRARPRRRRRPLAPIPPSVPAAKIPVTPNDWVTIKTGKRRGLIARVAGIDRTKGSVTKVRLERGHRKFTMNLSEVEFYSHTEPDVI
jgi:hypothetical protein